MERMEPPPGRQKTWLTWKAHWTRAFQENRAIQRLTGGTFMHQANSTVEDELSEKMVLSLDNLANTVIQKNDTVEELVITKNLLTVTNQKLTEHMAKLQEQTGKLLYILEKYAGGGAGQGYFIFMVTFGRFPQMVTNKWLI
jgi:chaperonin cofactor prefoldin